MDRLVDRTLSHHGCHLAASRLDANAPEESSIEGCGRGNGASAPISPDFLALVCLRCPGLRGPRNHILADDSETSDRILLRLRQRLTVGRQSALGLAKPGMNIYNA